MSAIAAPARAVARSNRVERSPAIRFYPLVLLGGLALVGLLMVIHISIGTADIPPLEVVKVLTGQQVDQLTYTVVHDLRMPRALVAIAAGAMLALAGAILQAITGNPLAEPDLTGATSGGVFLAVLWLSRSMVGWSLGPGGLELPLIALIGSLSAGGLVYMLSWQRSASMVRLVLTGVLVTTVLKAFTSVLLLVNQNAIGSILLWMIGSLNGRTWIQWNLVWPWALVAIPLGLLTAGLANVLQLGDEMAAGLGVRVQWARGGLLVAAVLLTAGAVSTVGALGFLGLIAPHLTRRLVGQDARRVFPLSAVLGAALLLGADVASRSLVATIDLPVGAVLALLGAPFLMYLLRRGLR